MPPIPPMDGDLAPSEIDESVPPPILMNCWKHHAGVVRARVAECVAGGEPAVRALPEKLVQIGTGLMDLYLGTLSIGEIAAQTIAHLDAADIADPDAFSRHLTAQGGYATFDMSDGSRWVIRHGTVVGRHVHLHPGRYSPLSLRVRANLMKTVIAVLAWAELKNADPLDVATINEARAALLDLSPVAGVNPTEGLGEVLASVLRVEK